MRPFLFLILSAIWLLSCQKPQEVVVKIEEGTDSNTIIALRDTVLSNGLVFNEIYSLSEDGTHIKCVFPFRPEIRTPLDEPCWGPGNKIVFISRHERPNYMIYVMNKDGSGVTRLTDTNDYHYELNVSMSSGRILFRKSDAIRSIKLDGTDLKTFSTAFIHYPTWHPDGQQIVYATDPFLSGQRQNNIYIANYDGTNTRQITHTNNRIYDYPCISPDGMLLSYVVDRRIYICKIDGSGEFLLDTQSEPVYMLKGWANDSKQLLVQGDGKFSFYLVKIDGTGINRIGTVDKRFYSPSIK